MIREAIEMHIPLASFVMLDQPCATVSPVISCSEGCSAQTERSDWNQPASREKPSEKSIRGERENIHEDALQAALQVLAFDGAAAVAALEFTTERLPQNVLTWTICQVSARQRIAGVNMTTAPFRRPELKRPLLHSSR